MQNKRSKHPKSNKKKEKRNSQSIIITFAKAQGISLLILRMEFSVLLSVRFGSGLKCLSENSSSVCGRSGIGMLSSSTPDEYEPSCMLLALTEDCPKNMSLKYNKNSNSYVNLQQQSQGPYFVYFFDMFLLISVVKLLELHFFGLIPLQISCKRVLSVKPFQKTPKS